MGNSQELAERNATRLNSTSDYWDGLVPWGLSRTSDTNMTEPGRPRAGRGQPVEASRLDGNVCMSDFSISDQGSIFLIRPLNEAARQWLDENVVSEPWQWVEGALCVEIRFACDLVLEIEEAGFEITR